MCPFNTLIFINYSWWLIWHLIGSRMKSVRRSVTSPPTTWRITTLRSKWSKMQGRHICLSWDQRAPRWRQLAPSIYSTSQFYHCILHDDVIKWKLFPRYWPSVREIRRSPVNSPHKGQWRRALIFSLICAWINGWVNNRKAGDLRHHRAHHDVTVMVLRQHYYNSISGNSIGKFFHKKCIIDTEKECWFIFSNSLISRHTILNLVR